MSTLTVELIIIFHLATFEFTQSESRRTLSNVAIMMYNLFTLIIIMMMMKKNIWISNHEVASYEQISKRSDRRGQKSFERELFSKRHILLNPFH